MPRILAVGAAIFAVVLASCSRGAKDAGSSAPDMRPFAGFVSQRIIVTPTGFVRGGDSLGWVQGMGGSRAAARQLDSSIARAFDERGLSQGWVMPAALSQTFERNRSYATDPYLLSTQPLRAASFVSGGRYGEPLSSQLRTMIALETEARYVLLPVELRFEKSGAGTRGVLRAAFLDPRTAEARWVGEVRGDAAQSATLALASVGQRLADLFSAP